MLNFENWLNEAKDATEWSNIALSVAYVCSVELGNRAQAKAQVYLNDDKNKQTVVDILADSHQINKICDILAKSGINAKSTIFENAKKARRELKEDLGII